MKIDYTKTAKNNMIDKMHFLEEEIIVEKLIIDKVQSEENVFTNSGMPHEKDGYGKFKVIKVGEKQTKLKVGDKILINLNGIQKPINIEGQAPIENTYAFMNHLRIFCKLDE